MKTTNTDINEIVSHARITDKDFRRDLKSKLRSHASLSTAKIGWLDQAIARGFGFSSQAAMLANSDGQDVTVMDEEFRQRIGEFGLKVPTNVFRDAVWALVDK